MTIRVTGIAAVFGQAIEEDDIIQVVTLLVNNSGLVNLAVKVWGYYVLKVGGIYRGFIEDLFFFGTESGTL